MPCRYFLGEKELSGNELTSYLKNLPHERKLELAPEIANDSYHRLSWTPGEAQAARYDLSKRVKEIEYKKLDDGDIALGVTDVDGRGIPNIPYSVKPDKLADYVGKEIAKSILDNASTEAKKLKGDNLKIGGEGMKGFYDQMIPKSLEKIGKEWGVKVQKGEINGGTGNITELKNGKYKVDFPNKKSQTYESWSDAEAALNLANKGSPVFYIDIPPAMRESVLSKGQALFTGSLPFTFVPVDYDPFSPNRSKIMKDFVEERRNDPPPADLTEPLTEGNQWTPDPSLQGVPNQMGHYSRIRT